MIKSEKELIRIILKKLSKTRFSPQITVKDIFDYIENKYKEQNLFEEIDKKVIASVIFKIFQDYFFVHISEQNPLIKKDAVAAKNNPEQKKEKAFVQIFIGQNPGKDSFKSAINILSEIFEDKKVFKFLKHILKNTSEQKENFQFTVETKQVKQFKKALEALHIRHQHEPSRSIGGVSGLQTDR